VHSVVVAIESDHKRTAFFACSPHGSWSEPVRLFVPAEGKLWRLVHNVREEGSLRLYAFAVVNARGRDEAQLSNPETFRMSVPTRPLTARLGQVERTWSEARKSVARFLSLQPASITSTWSPQSQLLIF